MRSRQEQLPAAEVIRVSSIVYIDAPSEVTFRHLCDPHDQSEWKPNFLGLIDEPDGPPPLGPAIAEACSAGQMRDRPASSLSGPSASTLIPPSGD